MKSILVFTATLLFLWEATQAQFTDNFSDGNHTDNPEWQGHTNYFIVNSSKQLQSSGPPASSSIYLSTPTAYYVEAEWNFYIKLDFTPSSQNYLRVYLSSDNPVLTESLNGYFLQLGGSTTANDSRIELYKQQGISPGASPPAANKIIQGTTGSLSATRNTVRIQVKRNAAGLWNLYTDYTGGYSFVMEGSGVDNTIKQTTHFGIVCRHSATRNDKFFFDDFKVGPLEKDTTPPVLKEISVLSSSQMEVKFNESLSITSAQDSNNYFIDQNIGKPVNVKINGIDPSIVQLTFDRSFPDNISCQLTVSNLEDRAGNKMPSPQAVTFTYLAPYLTQPGDIVINELMADEDPPVGLPKAEFVELYNTTARAVNLAGFTFADDATTVTLPDYTLAPHSYLILCATARVTDFQPYGAALGIAFPNLRNAGELLRLRNQEGSLLDQVHYQQTWYNDANKANGGWTLERINPYTPCTSPSNWTASHHESGGTPGSQNSVYNSTADTSAPSLVNILVISPTELKLNFSKSMDSLSLLTGTYSIDPPITVTKVTALGPEFSTAILQLQDPIQQGKVYSLKTSELQDCAGNALKNATADFGSGRKAMAYEVVINEIFARETPAVGLPEREYIELYNTTGDIIDLSECWYADSTSTVKLPPILMLPHEYLILCANSAVTELSRFGKTRGIANWPALNSTGEPLTLRNSDGSLIHSLTYSDNWYGDAIKKAGGWALEMVDPTNPCAGASNWTASEAAIGGTPGKINSVKASNPDLTAPKLHRAIAIDAYTVVLQFDETIDSLSALSAVYTAQNFEISAASYSIKDPASVYLHTKDSLLPNITYSLRLQGLKDCSGNYIMHSQKASFVLAQQGEPGDIVLNEVLYNPNTGGVEFVELYNRTTKTIDLKNWKLGTSKATAKSLGSKTIVIAPYQYLALTKDAQILKNQYPRAREENFHQMTNFPALHNTGDTIVLISNLEVEIERMEYYDQMHFSLLNNSKGVSLERIRPDMPANNPNNWQSAASSAGYATPGYLNSQHLEQSDIGKRLYIEPKVFTPDEDGHTDFTTINYDFSQGGYVATITIFDAQGREIKKVASNELLGTQGFYRWDGTNSLGLKANVGYYIVLFEIFNLEGDLIQHKETVAIGANFR